MLIKTYPFQKEVFRKGDSKASNLQKDCVKASKKSLTRMVQLEDGMPL